jgi:acyl carrier protein
MQTAHIRQTVIDTVAEVLTVEPDAVLAVRELTELPGYTSFAILDVIQRVEEALGAEAAAADLTPENLHRLDGLCQIFARYSSAQRG